MKRFGMRVLRLRKREGKTLAQIAAAGGPSDKRMLTLEKGRYPVPDDETLAKLEAALPIKPGTARTSLYDDTELELVEKKAPAEDAGEPATYTEADISARQAFEAALERLGVTEVSIFKRPGGEGFVLSREDIEAITAQLNALPPDSP